MKKSFNEKTKREKIVYIIRQMLQFVVLLILAYIIFLRIKTGQHIPMPLIGCILLVLIGISRIISVRNDHQGSEEDRKKFNKIVLRSVLITIVITITFIVAVVLYAIHRP